MALGLTTFTVLAACSPALATSSSLNYISTVGNLSATCINGVTSILTAYDHDYVGPQTNLQPWSSQELTFVDKTQTMILTFIISNESTVANGISLSAIPSGVPANTTRTITTQINEGSQTPVDPAVSLFLGNAPMGGTVTMRAIITVTNPDNPVATFTQNFSFVIGEAV